MVLKLYGYSPSTSTRLAALISKEKEVPYKLVTVDITKGEQKLPEYLKIQPFGQIPCIDDNGRIIYESRAIARYLIKKHPHQGTLGLIPTDLTEEALFEQAASVEVSNFSSQVGPLITEKVSKPAHGEQPDEKKIEELLKQLNANLDVYETILSKQKYVAGDKLTLADLQHLPNGSMLFVIGYKDLIEKRPNVFRWWTDISSRPAWEAVKDGA